MKKKTVKPLLKLKLHPHGGIYAPTKSAERAAIMRSKGMFLCTTAVRDMLCLSADVDREDLPSIILTVTKPKGRYRPASIVWNDRIALRDEIYTATPGQVETLKKLGITRDFEFELVAVKPK